MRVFGILLLIFIISCSTKSLNQGWRVPAAKKGKCAKAIAPLLERKQLTIREGWNEMDVSEQQSLEEVARSLRSQGIDYREVNVFGSLGDRFSPNVIQIVPDPEGHPINRYVATVEKRFGGTKVFYLERQRGTSLGTFHTNQNAIYLNKEVMADLSGEGWSTMSHEARHAMYEHHRFLGKFSSYNGEILVQDSSIRMNKFARSGYSTYASFEESKTHLEDGLKYLRNYKKALEENNTQNAKFWLEKLTQKSSQGQKISLGLTEMIEPLKFMSANTFHKKAIVEAVEKGGNEYIRVRFPTKYFGTVGDFDREKEGIADIIFKLSDLDEKILKAFKKNPKNPKNLSLIKYRAHENMVRTYYQVRYDFFIQKSLMIIVNSTKNGDAAKSLFNIRLLESAVNFGKRKDFYQTALMKDLKESSGLAEEALPKGQFEAADLIMGFINSGKKREAKLKGKKVIRYRLKDYPFVIITDPNGKYLGIDEKSFREKF